MLLLWLFLENLNIKILSNTVRLLAAKMKIKLLMYFKVGVLRDNIGFTISYIVTHNIAQSFMNIKLDLSTSYTHSGLIYLSLGLSYFL